MARHYSRFGWVLRTAALAAGLTLFAGAPAAAEENAMLEPVEPAPADGAPEPAPAVPPPATPLDAALAALRAQGLPADPAALARPLIEAAVRALDPGGRVMDAKAAASSEPPHTPSEADPPPVEVESLPRRLRILRIGRITDAAGDDVVRELEAAVRDSIQGIALDLRRANGDSLAAVARITARFARPGADLFVVRDGRGDVIRVFAAPPAAPSARPLPLPAAVVLVGPETRGAAEVLAAALDRQPGVLSVGRASASDPLIREIVALTDDLAARIAVRRIEFPDGGALDAERSYSPRLSLPEKAPADPGEPNPNGRLTDRRKTLPQEAEDRALRDRVRGDPDLRSVTDLLLALIATRPVS